MSEYKLKDDYVAQVVMLTAERNRLRSELAGCVETGKKDVLFWTRMCWANMGLGVCIGYFLACITWRLFK